MRPKRGYKKEAAIDSVALTASRVLSKFGEENPDYQEWQDLKNALLELHPYLNNKYIQERVGGICSHFNRHGPHGMNSE